MDKGGFVMLEIIYGRPGSGKTQNLMQKIKDNSIQNEKGQVLIVPEQYSHETERQLCKMCGDDISLYAEVLSFSRLCSRVFAQSGGLSARSLDGGGRILCMRLALDEVKSRLKLYARPSGRTEFLEKLLGAADEFKSYCVTTDQMRDLSEKINGGLSEKLAELALIFDAYDAVSARSGCDPREKTARLVQGLEESDFAKGRHFYIDCFSDFTPLERRVVETLIHRAKSVTISLACDSLEDDGDTFFSAQRKTAIKLFHFAQIQGQEIVLTKLEGNKRNNRELAFLEKNLMGFSNETFNDECNGILLYITENKISECEWAAGEITRLVRENGVRHRDITVAVADESGYAAVAEDVFSKYDIPVFTNDLSDIMQKPVMALVTAALDTVSGNFLYEDVFRYLKTGLTGISSEDCDLLENYVLKWSIRGSLWTRQEPWTFHPKGYGEMMRAEDKKELERLNEIRRRIQKPLIFLKEGMRRGKTTGEKIVCFYEFLTQLDVSKIIQEKSAAFEKNGEQKLADEYLQLWEILCGALDQVYDILSDREMDTVEFTRLFQLTLSQYSIGTIPVSLDRVVVGNISRMRHAETRYLFVLGMTDEAFFAQDEGSSLITEDERQTLLEMGMELAPNAADRLDQELGAIHSALACSTDGLYLSYPAFTETGAEIRPSFLVQRLIALFPKLEPVSGRLKGKGYALEAKRPAFELACMQTDRPETRASRQLARAAFANLPEGVRLNRILQLAGKKQQTLSKEHVTELFGGKLRLSASRADRYQSCRFSYFMEYGLNAKPRSKAGFQAPEFGTFIHYVLEYTVDQANKMGGFSKVEKAQLRQMVDEAIGRYTADMLGGLLDKSKRFCYLFTRLKRSVYAIVESVAEEFAVSEFTPMAFELQFAEKGALPPVEVAYENGTVSVGGIVDRVDGYVQGGKLYLRVVDYKTGKKAFDFTDIWHGMGIQMLIYLFALEKMGQSYFGKEIVPAGVLYIPAREVIVRSGRQIDDAELEKQRKRELKRSGLLLSDEGILRAMERFESGQAQYLPVRADKEGNLTGTLATVEQLGKLSRHVDQTLKEIGLELNRGKIEVNPYYKNRTMSACDYCEYSAACQFDQIGGRDKKRYLYPMKAEEFWAALDQEGGADGEN